MIGQVTASVVVKTVISPLVGFGVAYIAAVTTHHEAARPRVLPDLTAPLQHGLS